MTLGSGFTREELKGAKYIVVKATLRKDKEMSLTGLLFGFRPLVGVNTQIVSKDEKFIWLLKGDEVHILNANHYLVNYIEIGKETSIKYSASGDLNIKRLEAIVDAMEFYKMTEPNGLIDISKYEDLPADIKVEIEKSPAHKENSNIRNRSGSQSNETDYLGRRKEVCGYSKRKEITTAAIHRTTKYSISQAIERMREKVEQIRKGEYAPPKLKEISASEKEGAESQKKAKESSSMKEDTNTRSAKMQAHHEEMWGRFGGVMGGMEGLL